MPYDIPGIEYTDPKGNTHKDWTTITFEQVQSLITPFLLSALSLYSEYLVYGLPNGKPVDERSTILDIIKICKTQSQIYDEYEMEKTRKEK